MIIVKYQVQKVLKYKTINSSIVPIVPIVPIFPVTSSNLEQFPHSGIWDFSKTSLNYFLLLQTVFLLNQLKSAYSLETGIFLCCGFVPEG